MLFGDDYLKFKDFVVEDGSSLCGSVEQRRFRDDPNDVEFKVRHIELPADAKSGSHGCGCSWIQALDEERLRSHWSDDRRRPGSVASVEVHDQGMAEMPSRSHKVTLSDDFVDQLEELVNGGGLHYRLETSSKLFHVRCG